MTKSLEKSQLGGPKDDFLKIISKSVDRSLNIYLKAVNAEDQDDEQDDETLLKIGALAKKAGETVATIRFWTKEGLLQIAETTPSNYARQCNYYFSFWRILYKKFSRLQNLLDQPLTR